MWQSVGTCCGHLLSRARLLQAFIWSQQTARIVTSQLLYDMELCRVVQHLQEMAPTSMAGSWDNVGLLVEPSPPHIVSRILLTNDLTEPVMEEAVTKNVNMILSYHPPIFLKLKRVTQSSWKERIVVKCIENRIAVFSPHTSHDALLGGVNDWLIQPFVGKSEPIETVSAPGGGGHCAKMTIAESEITDFLKVISKMGGVKVSEEYRLKGSGVRLVCRCSDQGLLRLVGHLDSLADRTARESLEVSSLEKVPSPQQGPGRLIKLDTPLTLDEVVEKVKIHLGLLHIRVAEAVDFEKDKKIKKIAVCAGSGSSILLGVSADLYLTGEMSHHEVLDAIHSKRCVILCDHSNTERGYLQQVLQARLTEKCEGLVEVLVSTVDTDPLRVI